MQNNFQTYSSSQLPAGFKYPERYLELARCNDLHKDLVWWFEDATTESGKLAWRLRHSHGEWPDMEGRNLIPFAQLNDDAAFFDGGDLNGNPRVVVIDLGNKARAYLLPSFDDWLHSSLQD